MSEDSSVIPFPIAKDQKLGQIADSFGSDNAEQSLNELLKLINNGCYEASAFVGAIYEFGGKNVDINYENAKFYYEQSIEKYGAIESYFGLIRLYYYGKGVNIDYCKVLELASELSDETDNAIADFILGKLYLYGQCVEIDIERAKEYFEKSWNSGYVFGLTYLGMIEQQMGSSLKGIYMRLKAGLATYKIAKKNANDPRIREI